MKNTVLTYRINGVTYRKVFPSRVSRGTVEAYLVMEKHLGVSQHGKAIVSLENLLN